MPTNNTLNAAGQVSTTVLLTEGQSANYSLTPTAYSGPVILERGDSPNAMVAQAVLPSNATGVLYGPAYYRFRMAQNYVSGSVASSINDPAISSLRIRETVALTQAAFNALPAPDSRTLYLIVG